MTLYHGSAAVLVAGTTLIPPGTQGAAAWGSGEDLEWVFVTPSTGIARNYAGPDGYVYEVEVEGDMVKAWAEVNSFACRSARVVRAASCSIPDQWGD